MLIVSVHSNFIIFFGIKIPIPTLHIAEKITLDEHYGNALF
jgi:hypothetical protein